MNHSSKLKVLIIDDEQDIGNLIVDIVSPCFEGVYAPSAEEGQKIIEKLGAEIVCVVSDYKMGGMNGIEFRLAMSEKQKEIPFILLSGYITKEDAMAGVEAKISAFQSKPFDPDKLLDLIKRLGNERESTIRERIALEQIFIEEASNIVEELEPLIMSLEQNPNDMETLNIIFRLVHTIKGSSGVLESIHIRTYVHKYEDLLSKLKTGAMAATPEIISVLLQGFDVVGQMIAALRKAEPWTKDVEALATIFDVKRLADNSNVEAAGVQGAANQVRTDAVKDTVNVPSAMLDEFMELSGEITVIRNMVNKLVRVIEKEAPSNRNVQHLGELLDEMHKINSGMQGRLVETRKVPLSKVFRPLPRTVRDTARALGKNINLKVEGDTIRVDTSLAQALSDSLVHIVRNSLDHGIEQKELRIQRKKNAEGSITIRAVELGEEIVISIQDDGGGLDVSRIKKKAVERGLYSSADIEQLPAQKIYSLIFESGFSTAQQVTDVSGRGVGMDMVRSSVQKVKGRIDIDSELGKGTKFSLHLPIPKSVLIISSLVVEAAGYAFAIPQDSISRLLRLEGKRVQQSIKTLEGAYVLEYEGRLIPIADLGETLGLRARRSVDFLKNEIQNILIVKTEESFFSLTVDRVLDSEEIVVKNVGKHLERLKVYAGATFMGDGRVGLILSVEGVAETAGVMGNRVIKGDDGDIVKTAKQPDNTQEILLFSLWCDGSFAVPLSLIHRLEELPRSSFQVLGERQVVIYREQVVPLVDLSEVLGLKTLQPELKLLQDPVSIFVIMIHDRYVAFIIRQIKDVCSVSNKLDTAVRDRDAIAGTIEVNGRVVSMLDIFSILDGIGILKTLDPEKALSKFAHGPDLNQEKSAPKMIQPALEESEKKNVSPTEFAGDGWGIF